MTQHDQVKALAELEGWTLLRLTIRGAGGQRGPSWHGHPPGKNYEAPCNHYLTSFDAIKPLRISLITTPELKVKWLNAARALLTARIGKLVSDYDLASLTIAEEAEVLLRVFGKWTD